MMRCVWLFHLALHLRLHSALLVVWIAVREPTPNKLLGQVCVHTLLSQVRTVMGEGWFDICDNLFQRCCIGLFLPYRISLVKMRTRSIHVTFLSPTSMKLIMYKWRNEILDWLECYSNVQWTITITIRYSDQPITSKQCFVLFMFLLCKI